MKHSKAFELVCEHAPQQAGMLWDTTDHTGCDTATAVADQYGEDEDAEAIVALQRLARGEVPEAWEPHR